MEQGDKSDNNIRTEYEAISAKLNQLPSFRFALAGFYVAGVGVVASIEHPTKVHFIMLFLITIALWLIDLRTRGLLETIGRRGAEIERVNWGHSGWISRMRKEEPAGQKEDGVILQGQKDTVKCFFWRFGLPRWVHHSLGFDTLFLVVLVYSVYRILTVTCWTRYPL
ncbi:MAG: hypothetical protein ISS70_09560 [Phycisphaerae bacterium]|nr:hypothetical protein [Phycisphaerae bacterium]